MMFILLIDLLKGPIPSVLLILFTMAMSPKNNFYFETIRFAYSSG